MNTDKCDMRVFNDGVSVGMFDMPKAEAEIKCKELTEETGLLHDWHFFAGRVHIKKLLVDSTRGEG